MVEWLAFDGSAIQDGSQYRLQARSNNGAILLPEEDVNLESDIPFIKNGAIAAFIDQPWFSILALRPAVDSVKDNCPSGITCCIGGIHLCCDDHRVIGSCAGSYDCSRPPFQPG